MITVVKYNLDTHLLYWRFREYMLNEFSVEEALHYWSQRGLKNRMMICFFTTPIWDRSEVEYIDILMSNFIKLGYIYAMNRSSGVEWDWDWNLR